MRRRINAHWSVVRIFGCDVVVHLKEIAVTLFDRVASEPLDCVCEIEIHPPPPPPLPPALLTHFLSPARGRVPPGEDSQARIPPLGGVITVLSRGFLRRARSSL